MMTPPAERTERGGGGQDPITNSAESSLWGERRPRGSVELRDSFFPLLEVRRDILVLDAYL